MPKVPGKSLAQAHAEWRILHSDIRGDIARKKARRAEAERLKTLRSEAGRLADVLSDVLLDRLIAEERKANP